MNRDPRCVYAISDTPQELLQMHLMVSVFSRYIGLILQYQAKCFPPCHIAHLYRFAILIRSEHMFLIKLLSIIAANVCDRLPLKPQLLQACLLLVALVIIGYTFGCRQ